MKKLSKDCISRYLAQQPLDRLFSFDITPFIEVHEFQRHEYIIQEGQTPYYLYYVISGKGKIYSTQENGKVTLLNFIQAGSFFGEIELLQNEHYSKGIQTSSTMYCFALPIKETKELLLHDALFLRHLCTFISHKATSLATKYVHGLTFPFENRLAEFLLLSSYQGIYNEKHTEICEYLGVSYRHLLYVLAQFVRDGILKKEGKGYRILNPQLLQSMAITAEHSTLKSLQFTKHHN